MADSTVSQKTGPPTSARPSLSSIGKPVYLELCIKSAPGRKRLAEIIIVDGMGQQLINTDVELFASIRKAYNSTKREGLFRIFAFMFRPDNIRFVRFGMHIQRACIFGLPKKTPCIPPPVEVDEQRYHYSGHLVEEMPMHPSFFYTYYWQDKRCDPRSAIFLNRLPKKLGTSLAVLSSSNPSGLEMAWGIHIIERPNKAVLAALLASFFVLSSVFAVGLNAYIDVSECPLIKGYWFAVALAWALLAFYFAVKDQ